MSVPLVAAFVVVAALVVAWVLQRVDERWPRYVLWLHGREEGAQTLERNLAMLEEMGPERYRQHCRRASRKAGRVMAVWGGVTAVVVGVTVKVLGL